MMKTKISPREWEALSAYLDGQLGPKDRTRLESRLKENLDLRSALDDLRRTRIVLRSQPRMRAPRNFTLTPEMVGRGAATYRSVSPAFSTLRLVSAFASVLLVIVLIGDFFSRAPAASPSQNAALSAASSEQTGLAAAPAGAGEAGAASPKFAPQPFSAQAETPAAGVAASQITEQPLAGAARIMAATPTEALAAAPAVTVGLGAGAPAETQTPEAAQAAAAIQAPAAAEPPAPTATLAEQAPIAPFVPDNTTQATAGSIESVPAAHASQPPAQPQAAAAPNPYPLVEPGRRAGRLSDPATLRALEIGLGLLAVLTGFAAFYLRRPHG